MTNEDKEKIYMNLFRVPKTSFQAIKSRRPGHPRRYYENLLQVVILD